MYDLVLDNILDALETLRTKKRVYIFGTRRIGKMSLTILKQFGLSNIYFVDNNSSMWGRTVAEVPVLQPEVLKNTETTDFILVASTHYPAISSQLDSYGLEKDVHYIIVMLPTVNPESKTTENQVIDGVKIGKYSFGYQHLIDSNRLLAEVGAFCSINPGAKIVPNHPTEYITTHTFLYVDESVSLPPENVPGIMKRGEVFNLHAISKNGKVHIGNDVWIGTDVVIMPGLKIGNGAIIGANAVVTKDIPDYAIAVGVPAKIIRYRFSEEQIQILNEVQWWNWPDEKIRENFKLFVDKEGFFTKFAPAGK